MPLLPWGEFKPDVSDYESQMTQAIKNVIPRGDGYGPFQDSARFSQALPDRARGGFFALKSDGSVVVFAGTATKLYRLDATTYTWVDVSKSGGSYSALSADAQWQFRQFNNFVIAVQANTVPQVFDISVSSAFADLAGSPPQASYIEIVGRFVVLAGLLSQPFRIQWSGLNAPTTWTPGVNSSDYQDFPDGGIVRGVAGGEFGIIFQDQAIRRMSYIPGSTLIFQIERISQDKGLFAPYSIVRAGGTIYFYAGQGFHKIVPGGYPEQIGREKVDRSFLSDLDRTNLRLFMGASDPRSTRIYWAYKSNNGTAGFYDKLLGYDTILDRFFPIQMMGEILLGISQPGQTLESLDAISASIDAMTLSLDAYGAAGQPEIAQFDSANCLAFFRGPNMEATLQTGEQGTDARRLLIRGFRPITDAVTVFGSVRYRDTQQSSPVAGAEVAINTRTGRIDLRRSTRYARFTTRIPAGQPWTFSAGVEPDLKQEGLM